MSRLNNKNLIQGTGLLDQIQSSSQIPYKSLTEDSIRKFMKDLCKNPTQRDKLGRYKKYEPIEHRSYVIYTGQSDMFMFDLAMQGIKLPKGITFKLKE